MTIGYYAAKSMRYLPQSCIWIGVLMNDAWCGQMPTGQVEPQCAAQSHILVAWKPH